MENIIIARSARSGDAINKGFEPNKMQNSVVASIPPEASYLYYTIEIQSVSFFTEIMDSFTILSLQVTSRYMVAEATAVATKKPALCGLIFTQQEHQVEASSGLLLGWNTVYCPSQ
ncbi:TPA: hypothetical protein ACKP2K_000685 [Serratia marcescens]